MFDLHKPTAQDALDMIEACTAPLNFGSGKGVYRAAVKRLAKTDVSHFLTGDLSNVPMSLDFLEILFQRIDENPAGSKTEKEQRSQWKSRLRTVARRLEGKPLVQSSSEWDLFLDAVEKVAKKRGMAEQALIPIRSSLRKEAINDEISPQEMSRPWVIQAIARHSAKKRGSLKEAARVIDAMMQDLPKQLRPAEPFGALTVPTGNRRSLPLPLRVSEELETYLAERVAGKTVKGFNRTITVGAGIKSDESTNIYRQAVGWLFDALCTVGVLTPDADIGLTDLARLDWIGKVAFEALADIQSDDSEPKVFPWHPIQANTIYNRVSSITTMFKTIAPSFITQRADLHDPTAPQAETLCVHDLLGILKSHFKKEMTEAHKAFCRAVIIDEDRQRLLLNMHTICWADAQAQWKAFETQTHHQQMQTMNRCILAAILAIVVNYPFRAKTVMSLHLKSRHPDLSLPDSTSWIEFHIAPERMKFPKPYDAVLKDTPFNQPRKILDWFINGPRRLLLNDTRFLGTNNKQPNLLFCGVGRSRYNRILANWTEDAGMRMTTHLFRHAIASIMVNCCDCPIEQVARMLGNTIDVAERQYAFHDLIKRRTQTMQRIEEHRMGLRKARHPGRQRKAGS